MAFNISLPDINGDALNSKQGQQKILDALYQLDKQLRYTLDNIGKDNLDTELSDFVEKTEESGQQFAREIKDAQGNLSRLSQTGKKIALTVQEQGGRLSEIAQTARSIEMRVNGESRVYRAETPPVPSLETPVEDGDLWVDTAHENAVYRYENGEWTLTEGAALDERIAKAESSIVQNADSIRLRVEKNGVVSAINQSAETVSIEAKRINFNGAVSANGNFRINTDGTIEAVNGRFGGELTADVTYCNSLQFRSGAEMLLGQWRIGYQGIYYPSGYGYNYLAFLFQSGQAYLTSYAHMNLGPDPAHDLHITGRTIDFSITDNYFGAEMIAMPNYSQLSFVPKADRTCNLGCGPYGGANSRLWDYAGIRYIYCPDGVHSGSSRVIKHGIRELPDQGAVVDALEPVTYVLNDDETGREQLGLVYEDTVGAAPMICSQRIKDDPYTSAIEYARLSVILLKEVKALRGRVAQLEAKMR